VNSSQWQLALVLMACLFQNSTRLKQALLAWMLEKDNEDFANSIAFHQLQKSYEINSLDKINRWLLLQELVKFKIRNAGTNTSLATPELNP